jgi:hypothetical protein
VSLTENDPNMEKLVQGWNNLGLFMSDGLELWQRIERMKARMLGNMAQAGTVEPTIACARAIGEQASRVTADVALASTLIVAEGLLRKMLSDVGAEMQNQHQRATGQAQHGNLEILRP